MALRFFRRMKLAPGLTFNLSKGGASLSFGPRGGKFTVGTSGMRATAGLPGTGLFYTRKVGTGSGGHSGGRSPAPAAEPAAPQTPPEEPLDLGFFQRLVTPPEEKAFVEGCKALMADDTRAALRQFAQAAHLADGAFLAGMLSLGMDRHRDAARYLAHAVENHRQLTRHVDKYGLQLTLRMEITPEIEALLGPELRSALLALVEAYQGLEQWDEAMACLQRLYKLEPDDAVVRLSYVELALEARPNDRRLFQRVVGFTGDVENESAIHAALLLYRARALRGLGLDEAARVTLTAALRRRKDRPESLMRALRYERGCVCEALGQHSRARRDFERLYAEDSGYADVAQRLGLR